MGVKRAQDEARAVAAKKSKHSTAIEDVVRAVEAAADRQELSQAGRTILAEMVRHGLATAVEERHELQVQAVARVAEALEEEQAALKKALADVEAKLQEATSQRDSFETERNALEEELACKATPARSAKVSLADVTKAVLAATKELKSAEGAKDKGDVERNVIQAEKDELAGAISTHLGTLRTGASDGDACPHLTALLALARRLDIDEALVSALPHTVAKAPEARRRFDELTLDQYEEGITGRITALDGQLEATAPEAKARADAVKSCKEAVDAAKATLLQAAGAFKGAQAAHQAATAALQDADKKQKETKKAVKTMEQAVKDRQAEVELYETGTLATFQALKERSVQATVPQQQEEEAPAEADASKEESVDASAAKVAPDTVRQEPAIAVGGQ